MQKPHPCTNHLIDEESPYLQQHAHNPIDWYPWGEEAFEKAEREDKLIFLSIGYSTCHWCHVMAHESFENEKIAEFINRHYLNIKVDREELPHIDRYYQENYMLLNKRAGGWPLTIVMTPDRKPFYAATYLPPFNRHGRPGLFGMMQYLYETFREKRENVYESADSIDAAMADIDEKRDELPVEEHLEANAMMARFVEGVGQQFDDRFNGIGDAPKFPHASTLGTLLTIYRLSGDARAREMALETLTAMARGGIFDQVEGGFYRYSVDEAWMVPHFEKMLYTNAELLGLYTEAYRQTEEPLYRETICMCVENIESRFLDDGLCFSASDADSDGEEGRYFLFGYDEAKAALREAAFTPQEAESILSYLHITPEGNFEGKNNPFVTDETPPPKLAAAKAALYTLRQKRDYPFIDYKIQTSWNALWIKALFKAAAVEPEYLQKATTMLDRLLERLYIDGLLYHQIVQDRTPKMEGYLEDYAFLADALIEAYTHTLQERYLHTAVALAAAAKSKFYREDRWYMSDDRFDSTANLYDSAYRSAHALMLDVMLKLANLTEDHATYADVEAMIEKASAELAAAPHDFPTLMHVWLGVRYGYSSLKAPKEMLEPILPKLQQLRYPFMLAKATKSGPAIACKIDRCFAQAEDAAQVFAMIDAAELGEN